MLLKSFFHRKTSLLESLFDKIAGLKAWNFLKNRPQYKDFPVNFGKFFTSGWLLLLIPPFEPRSYPLITLLNQTTNKLILTHLSICSTKFCLNMNCILQCVSSNNTKLPDIILLIIQLDWTLTNCMIMINNQNIPYRHNLIQHNTFNK